MSLRILHLLNHLPNIGNGIVNVTVDLACVQRRMGHEVAVVSGGGELEAVLAAHQIPHHQLEQREGLRTALGAVPRLRSLLHELRPDIVHVHMMAGVLIARLARLGLPCRIVSTVHNEFQRSAVLMGLADRVIAVSAKVKSNLTARGLRAGRIDVVPNATVGSPRRREPTGLAPPVLGRPSIVTIAGMFERKGVRDLIEAFDLMADEYPAAQLYLVGNGPDRTAFETRAAASPYCTRIHFEGFRPDVDAYLAQTDIFVLASHREPFGLVLAEAREAGAATIGTRVDGIPEVLEGGERGLLVPACHPPALADALRRLLGSPQELAAWKARAAANLDWLHVDRMAADTDAVYARCLGATANHASTSRRANTAEGPAGPSHPGASPPRRPAGQGLSAGAPAKDFRLGQEVAAADAGRIGRSMGVTGMETTRRDEPLPFADPPQP